MPPTVESGIQSSIIPESRPVVATHADRATRVSGRARRDEWQRIIDDKLIEWGADSDSFDDEEIESPSREIVSLAIRIASLFRDADELPAHRVVPDANGGIVFERRTGSVSQKIHIWDDGTVEYIRMVGTRLAERQRML